MTEASSSSGRDQPDDRRGSILAELAFLLRLHLKRGDAPGRIVINAGLVPDMWADRRTRMVDLAVTFAPPWAEPETPDPVVVVAIASSATEPAARDALLACNTIPSVKEVLLLRASALAGEMLRRGEDGAWAEPEALSRGDRLVIESVGFARRLDELYATTDLGN